MVRIGISAYDLDVRDLVELAAAADELGFESLWLGEHIVLPIGYRSGHPTSGTGQHNRRSNPAVHARPIVDPATKLLDPLVALAGCAARTRSILLATGVYLVPLRSPVAVARMVHTLQGLSEGRFLLGAGAGWLEEEFAAVGVPFERRGERLEENLHVIRTALAGGPFRHEGRLHQLDGLQLCEAPVSVPVILGGNSERALRRAARLGDGWFSSANPDFDEARRLRDRLLALRDEAGRTGDFSIHMRIEKADPDVVARYATEGFDRIVVWADQVWPAKGDLELKRAALADAADRLGVHHHMKR
jgi:probable F420-dependent oxidoreductase